MAQQHQKWITLESCIYDYLNESEQSHNKYFRLFHVAYRVMEDLGLDFFYQVKSIKLVVNANKTVTLPPDYLSYTKLGVLNGLGEVVPLKYNDKLTTLNDLSPTRVTDTAASNFANYYSPSSPVFYNFFGSGGYYNMYGVANSGLYAGGFKIDIHNGVILLDAAFGYTNLVMEYTASPEAAEGQDYYVPMEFREAVIAWLAWKDVANIKGAGRRGELGTIRDRRHEFFEARRRGIAKFRPFYLDQAYLSHLDNARLVVKS